MELTGQARAVRQRIMAADAGVGATPDKPVLSLTLAFPRNAPETARASRDPFAFVAAPPPKPARIAAPPQAPPMAPAVVKSEPAKPAAPVEVKGIVSFPGGHLGIVNNQIVKVGDVVASTRVERITDTEIVFRHVDGSTRSVTLATVRPVPSSR
jgi:hypothetical protein